jgi:hypothetical protein
MWFTNLKRFLTGGQEAFFFEPQLFGLFDVTELLSSARIAVALQRKSLLTQKTPNRRVL